MITKEKIYSLGEVNPITKTVLIISTIILKENGIFLGQIIQNSCLFMPGQIEEVKAYLGVTESSEITYLDTIWTPEVIAAWNESQNKI